MIERVLLGALALLLLLAFLAPLESLRWWTRRKDETVLDRFTRTGEDDDAPPVESSARLFVVYLSGIGTVDGLSGSRRERAVLDALAHRLPDTVVAADVFPYAVENRGLTQRATTWFWGRLHRWQRVPVASLAANLINIRNALRVLVSADPRYGPAFNLAVAQEITRSLSRHGYDWSRRPPVAVIGYSGGGQIALGASWYLAGLDIPTSVVSIGGVLSGDPALNRLEHLWHLYGSRDRLQLLGPAVFPSRWWLSRLSAWNRADKDGRITQRCIGPMRHMGRTDYFDSRARTEDGTRYRNLTIDALVEVLGSQGIAT